MTQQGTAPSDGFEPTHGHAAALVHSDEELIAAATAFVRTGLDADDLVVVGGGPSFLRDMAEEFGSADGLEFDDGIRLNGSRAPDVLSYSARMSERAAGRGSGRLRLLAQVDYGESDPRSIREFACFEAVSNLLPTAAPTSVLCVYDTRRLAADLIEAAPCTHPRIVEGGRAVVSDRFVDPREFVRGMPLPEEPLQATEPRLVIEDAPTLAGLRHVLGHELTACVADVEQREDVHLAISEMAANAFRHGSRPVGARLWASGDRLVCTVFDQGGGLDPLYGYWPAHGDDLSRGGMGLWLARKLCDHVDVSSSDDGTTVRLATALR